MIIYCCPDLLFATKIRSTAEALGVLTRPVRDQTMLDNRLNQVDDGKNNAPVTALLVDLDTGEEGLALIAHARAACADLAVIAYGSHVEVERLDAARQAGADPVLTRGQFTRMLPELLTALRPGDLTGSQTG